MECYMFLLLSVTLFIPLLDCQGVTQYPNLVYPDQILFVDEDRVSKNVDRQIFRPEQQYNINNAQIPLGRPGVQYPINTQNVAPIFPAYDPNLTPFQNNRRDEAQRPVGAISRPTAANSPATYPGIFPNNLRPVEKGQRPDDDGITDEDDEKEIKKVRRTVRFDQTAAALTNFSLTTMRHIIRNKQGNAVASPYSIATLLSLLQQGASDLALQELSTVLQMSPQTAAEAFRSQTRDIKSRNSRNVLRTATNIFVANNFKTNPQFKEVAERDFDSGLTPTSFKNPTETAAQINAWVASKTESQIRNLITPDVLSVDTQMLLVNALYFKGLWQYPFRHESSHPDTFYFSNGAKKTTTFMQKRFYFQATLDTQTDSMVAVLPFERDEYSMMIILPSTLVNADDFLRSLTVSQLESYLNLRPTETVLMLPKFSIRADTDLTPVLKQMGVNKIFDQNSGLSQIGSYGSYTPQISSAVHSAVLTIDEEGATAAAASAFSVVALSNDGQHLFMKVNRPFIVVVWDGKTNVPLFVAKVEDPTL